MSATPINLISTDSLLYNFASSMNNAYGKSPMKNLGGVNFGMYTSDGDRDGDVDYEDDVLTLWLPNFGFDGYYYSDYNLNGTVDYDQDLLNHWLSNFGYSSQVPGDVLGRPQNIGIKSLKDILFRKEDDKQNKE